MSLACYQVRERYPEVECCPSCHDDRDQHGYDLLEGLLLEGLEITVCCDVYNWLQQHARLACDLCGSAYQGPSHRCAWKTDDGRWTTR